ncbi:MAG TPA: thioredoxin family protein [Thermodesulfatator sp.]|nr:thioredoxin family protein [Thermodesulfatator sp.]
MGRIRIGKTIVGIIGLSEAIAEVSRIPGLSREEVADRLLEIVSQKNYIPDQAREAYRRALLREYLKVQGEDVLDLEESSEPGPLSLKVLGPGCSSCESLYRLCLDVVAEMGLTADVEHITDIKEIARYGMVPTPGLVINDRLKCAGRLPARYEIEQWLREAGESGS